MYAIIRAGGKQAKVREGDVIDVERIKSEADSVTFTPLLLVEEDGTVISDKAVLAKASVTADVLGESRGEKIDIFKYKNKSGYRRRQGHRQRYTRIQVTGIATAPKKKATKKKAAPKKTEEAATATASDPADTAEEA
ncbi:MAG: 50S ribosomal protein L21 [Acidobacteria bacterium]|nr:50S ribosomal protein L21 [Acidobacteriota bacterium]NIO59153.1 50S ribosomal protein L21 [Acidobacteriota bacterium]NIT10871.1 50S ribosomal protein L21 [Acidobacteriota bacterium]